MIRTCVAAAVAAILLTAGSADAGSAEVGEGGAAVATAARKTVLTLSYTAEAGYAAAILLRCDPAGGAHPKKAKACRVLKKVNGNPARLKPAEMMCTMEYAPVTAQIKGTWRGRKVDWSHRFGNPCDMHRTTGVLMTF